MALNKTYDIFYLYFFQFSLDMNIEKLSAIIEMYIALLLCR
jgi:hypothetical protein